MSKNETRTGSHRRVLRLIESIRSLTEEVTPGKAIAIVVIGVAALGVLATFMANKCLNDANASGPWITAWTHNGVVRLQFAGDSATSVGVVKDWTQQCGSSWQSIIRRNLVLDNAFAILYSALLTFLVLFAARSERLNPLLRLLRVPVALLALAAGALDMVLENGALWIMVESGRMSTGWISWPAVARLASTFKFLLAAVTFLFLIATAIARLRRRARSATTEGQPQQPAEQQPGPPDPRRQRALLPQGKPLPGSTSDATATFTEVAAIELEFIHHNRHPDRSAEQVAQNLVGLSMSGGGIRSATTNLGILQGLAELKILPFVDYMCTVSGGGYIGSCLSSLLSIRKGAIPATGEHTLPEKPYALGAKDQPMFTTKWCSFPFRDDRVPGDSADAQSSRRAASLIAHLRTHGNFLVARRGVLSRDTLRALGNVITGIVYNVAGFLIGLATIAALYLVAASLLVPRSDVAYGVSSAAKAARPIAGAVIDRSRAVAADSSVVRQAEKACDSVGSTCRVITRVSLVEPSFSHALAQNASVTLQPFRMALSGTGNLRVLMIGSGLIGVTWTLAMLAMIFASAVWFDAPRLFEPEAGEAQDERFEKLLLNFLSISTIAVVALVAVVLEHWQEPQQPVAQLAMLWVPFMMLLGARLASIIVAVSIPNLALWTQRLRSLWGSTQSLLIYGLWMTAALVILAPLMFTFAEHKTMATLGGLTALGVSRSLAPRQHGGSLIGLRLAPWLARFLLGLAVFALIALGITTFGATLVETLTPLGRVLFFFGALVVLLSLGILVNHNKLSPHYFYRDRLAETYLRSDVPDASHRMWLFRDAMELELRKLHGEFVEPNADPAANVRNTAPYHLISAAINLAGSRDLTRKDRKSGYWLFSKLYCGSTHTGFRPTDLYVGGDTRVGRAIAISGAAASSGMGFQTFFAQSFATVLFNVRLGYWMANPAHAKSIGTKVQRPFWPLYLWREIVMATNERTEMVNLSDGGHTGDNVGIYPLLQRRCKIIIACDAEQDRELSFNSFSEALRHAYIDLGISVDIDLSMIRPDPETGRSRYHAAVGRIRYPDRPDQTSYLIYLKNSLTGDEPETVLNYEVNSPAFPHETTADQFFSDAQFESYRSLGVHIAKSTFARWAYSAAVGAPDLAHRPA
jgi:hypothetical protein